MIGRFKKTEQDRIDVETGTTQPQRILAYVQQNATRGDSESVIAAIDKFSWKVEWTMSVGDSKGEILDNAFLSAKARVVLELGSYIGYSAIRMARMLPQDGVVYSVEMGEDVASTTREIVDYTGLSSKIKVTQGKSSDVIAGLSDKYGIVTLDFVMLDHWEECYLPDLKALEKFLKKGSTVVADNAGWESSKGFLDYVTTSPKFNTVYFQANVQYTKEKAHDGMSVSVYCKKEM